MRSHDRPRFPGAVASPLTTNMEFLKPENLPPIATYRVMNLDGTLQDQNRAAPDVTDEQALTWYKNMLTGTPESPSKVNSTAR